jgi:predicted DNA binding CopG/RHH family protein
MAKSKKIKTLTNTKLRAHYDKTSELEADGALQPVQISFPKPRRLVALRLEEKTLDAVKLLAARKGLNYSTLMRMWITERLQHEKY